MVSLTPEAQFSSDGMRLTFSNNSMFSGSESNPESLIPEAVFKKTERVFLRFWSWRCLSPLLKRKYLMRNDVSLTDFPPSRH